MQQPQRYLANLAQDIKGTTADYKSSTTIMTTSQLSYKLHHSGRIKLFFGATNQRVWDGHWGREVHSAHIVHKRYSLEASRRMIEHKTTPTFL